MSEIPPTPAPGAKAGGRSFAGQIVTLLVALVALGGSAYYIRWQIRRADPYRYDPSQPIAFKDHVQSNVSLDGDLVAGLRFTDTAGKPFDLAQYRGRSHVVLVVTRGNTTRSITGAYDGRICLYCATQTSRLIANYKAIEQRGAEVVVVFPVQQAAEVDSLGRFKQVVERDRVGEAPFPLLLDVELRAVDQLGIRADMAKPATYILDNQGQLRFAYVGTTITDRPSIQAIVEQLDAINAQPQ